MAHGYGFQVSSGDSGKFDPGVILGAEKQHVVIQSGSLVGLIGRAVLALAYRENEILAGGSAVERIIVGIGVLLTVDILIGNGAKAPKGFSSFSL